MAMAVTPVVLVVLLAVVVSAPAAVVVLGADAGDGTTTHLSFFMHDIVSGANPTAVKVIKGPGATTTATALGMSFGDTTVVDDALTETSSPTSAAVGRMQGFYMLSSQSGAALMVCANLLLTSGDHNGSTIAVLGRDDAADDVRELAVVGGTGKYRLANGYVLWKPSSVSGADSTVQLDVYLTTGNGTIDAAAPADGGGGSGSSPAAGSGSKASSGTSRRSGGGWASACVVTVVVAVVGSCWVW